MIPCLQQLGSDSGLALGDEALARLRLYLQRLEEKNRVTNLTRICDADEVYWKHLVDSLAVTPELTPEARLADVGSGAGFPGFVLACLEPKREIHLFDAVRKKCDFLRETADELGLSSVTVHHLRVEDAGRGPERESFDLVVSRAFADPFLCLELQFPLAAVGGQVLLMEGPAFVATEVFSDAARLLGGGEIRLRDYPLDRFGGRRLVRVDKIKETPTRFPRRIAAIQNKPLEKLIAR